MVSDSNGVITAKILWGVVGTAASNTAESLSLHNLSKRAQHANPS